MAMADLRFDGRVAVITGAGRGLGRSYALLLASRGARVVVNDIGVTRFGAEPDAGPAQEVVNEIKAAGGEAVANSDSVSTSEGGKAIISQAIETFGRIDVLIANAGFNRPNPFKELTLEDFEAVLGVHLMGGYHVARAAFPLMCEQQYGRIVLTSSIAGAYSEKFQAGYAVSKAGLVGLSNVLAHEGAAEGVHSNAILPSAETRLAEGRDTSMFPDMRAELVAPMVAWLCHESCPVNGEMLVALAGRIARAYISETVGVYQPDWSIEQVAERWAEIGETKGAVTFPPLPSGFNDHLGYSFAMARAGGAK
jgi:NAD(P)-dependent dehydrogenase (short-subunit alcohol dehydrogenase family)